MTDLPEETVVDPAADEHVNEWERLHLIVESGDSAVAHAYLHSLPPGDIACLLGRVSEDEQRSFLTVLSEHDAADVIEALPELQAAQLMAVLPPEQAAAIFDHMESDEQADLLDQLSVEQSQAILDELPAEEAESIRFLANYNRDSAGGLMNTEYLAYRERNSVDDVLNDLRRFADDIPHTTCNTSTS